MAAGQTVAVMHGSNAALLGRIIQEETERVRAGGEPPVTIRYSTLLTRLYCTALQFGGCRA